MAESKRKYIAGRKLKLTKELINEACKALRIGNYVCTVCDYLGISESTWYKWFNAGEVVNNNLIENQGYKPTSKEILYYDFFKSTKKSQAESVIRSLAIIDKASGVSWQAAAWKLERTNQSLFAIKQNITIKHDAEGLDPDVVRARLAELRQKSKNNESLQIEATTIDTDTDTGTNENS